MDFHCLNYDHTHDIWYITDIGSLKTMVYTNPQEQRGPLNPEFQLDRVPAYVGCFEYGLQMGLLHPAFHMLEVF